ncbi:MAG: site-2 protease family protein [Pirellulales bacterium]
MDQLSYDTLALGLAWYFVFVMSTTCHEAAHAWAALRLGDPTAYLGGQVSLNPMPHIAREPLGMVLAPIASYLWMGWMFGWASAPYNPSWAARWPKRAAWMALAGPATNLALAILGWTVLWAGLRSGHFIRPDALKYSTIAVGAEEGFATSLATLASIGFSLNMILFVFNLLPIPPMDGGSVLPLLIGTSAAHKYQDFMAQPGFSFIGLIVAWNIFPKIFPYVFSPALQLLYR